MGRFFFAIFSFLSRHIPYHRIQVTYGGDFFAIFSFLFFLFVFFFEKNLGIENWSVQERWYYCTDVQRRKCIHGANLFSVFRIHKNRRKVNEYSQPYKSRLPSSLVSPPSHCLSAPMAARRRLLCHRRSRRSLPRADRARTVARVAAVGRQARAVRSDHSRYICAQIMLEYSRSII